MWEFIYFGKTMICMLFLKTQLTMKHSLSEVIPVHRSQLKR
ncbi:hypothetical protein VCRA2113O351_430001 [Vibrio crassostreae]|nr:hypothetical protein VCRA2113O351_430001 [Vibrio crassostreae]CAK3038173.1 hypothetical protein VCRA2120O151_530014 [Vibrio crassostreae]